jgi:hypothetical protein
MIQVRDVLTVKFGKIDQAVELFTKPTVPAPEFNASVRPVAALTDISGSMYTLVNEFIAPNLGEYEKLRDQQFTQPEFGKWFQQFQLFIEGGRREYYNIEGDYTPWSRPGRIVVREAYRAYKWQIRNAVSLLQRYGALLVDRGVGQNPHVLSDLAGPMFHAIIEIETESMSAWEETRRALYRDTDFQVWFVQLQNAVEAGSHEFYRVEYTGGLS